MTFSIQGPILFDCQLCSGHVRLVMDRTDRCRCDECRHCWPVAWVIGKWELIRIMLEFNDAFMLGWSLPDPRRLRERMDMTVHRLYELHERSCLQPVSGSAG